MSRQMIPKLTLHRALHMARQHNPNKANKLKLILLVEYNSASMLKLIGYCVIMISHTHTQVTIVKVISYH